MSVLMKRLEALQEFQKKDNDLHEKATQLQAEAKQLEEEFQKYMREEFGFPQDKKIHLAQILKVAIESSYEKTN